MDKSEEVGLKSHFYFIPTFKGEEDFQYKITSPKALSIIDNITKRDHIVGIHGSCGACCDRDRYIKEKQRFDAVGVMVNEGRQHYLRFQNTDTWSIQAAVGVQIDSTIGFYDHIGFRSGTCYQYTLFDVIKIEEMTIKESPLIVMEGVLVRHNLSISKFVTDILELSDITKKI